MNGYQIYHYEINFKLCTYVFEDQSGDPSLLISIELVDTLVLLHPHTCKHITCRESSLRALCGLGMSSLSLVYLIQLQEWSISHVLVGHCLATKVFIGKLLATGGVWGDHRVG